MSEKIQGLLASGVRKQFEAEERGSVWEPGQATVRDGKKVSSFQKNKSGKKKPNHRYFVQRMLERG